MTHSRRKRQFGHVAPILVVDVVNGLVTVAPAAVKDAGLVRFRQKARQRQELPAGDEGDDADVLDFDGPSVEADQAVQFFIFFSARREKEHHFDEDLGIDVAVPGQVAKAPIGTAVVLGQGADAVLFKDVEGNLRQRRQGTVAHLPLGTAPGQDVENPFLVRQNGQDQLFGTRLFDGQDEAVVRS